MVGQEAVRMDDLEYGTRDKRGNWVPHPWNAFHMATAIIWVNLLIPSWPQKLGNPS